MRGDQRRQCRLKNIGQKLAYRLIARYKRLPANQRPAFWFTYHLYHKAPDWLGPLVSEALGIPYILAEASYSPKQLNGPWHNGLQASISALKQTDYIFCINPADITCLKSLLPNTKISHLNMFLEPEAFPNPITARTKIADEFNIDPRPRWLICVAMMRPGDKEASYKILAEALKTIKSDNWRLLIVGDGTAASRIKAFFKGNHGIHFLGIRNKAEIQTLLVASDLFVWPAVNEALGMAMLEAQACNTPVLAGHEGGIRSIVAENRSAILVEPRNASAFADALADLLNNHEKVQQMGRCARSYTEQHHSLTSAADQIRSALQSIAK